MSKSLPEIEKDIAQLGLMHIETLCFSSWRLRMETEKLLKEMRDEE